MNNIPVKVVPEQFQVMSQLGFDLNPHFDEAGQAVWNFNRRIELTMLPDQAPTMPQVVSLVEIATRRDAIAGMQASLKHLLGIR